MVISRLVPISISPLGGSDSGEALQPRAAHQVGPQRLGPGPLSGSLPGTTLERRARGVAAAPSVVPRANLPPLPGDPTSSLLGAPRGAWRGRARAPGSRGLEVSILLPPGRGPLTSASRLLTQRHPPRRRTYRPERAPGTGERTGRLAGGCVRASVRVCVCPCLCVTGAVRRSVRLRVRGRPSVGLSAEPSVPRS